MVERLLPASFAELLGGLLLIAALVVAIVSLSRADRRPAVRISALLFIASLCLFSGSGGVYFTGVLIIAVTVSELGFLENVATLVRDLTHGRHSSHPPRDD